MALINITYNTADKSMSCKMDDKEFENLVGMSFMKDGKKWRLSARMMKHNEEEDYTSYEDLYAALNPVQKTLEQSIAEFISKGK